MNHFTKEILLIMTGAFLTADFLLADGSSWAKGSSQADGSSWAKGSSSAGRSNASVIYRNEQLVKLNPDSIQQITVPVVYENGILFTYSGADEDEVYVSGEFWAWIKKKKLKKNVYGIYYTFIHLEIGSNTYPYRYLVNDIWVNDPEQTYFVHDGYGTKMSALKLKGDLIRYVKSPKYLGGNKFHFFLKDDGFKAVSLVGTRNNWDPFVEEMVLKNNYWMIELEIHPKKTFYRYWVDGETILDPANHNVAMRKHEEKVNYIPKW